MQAETQTLLNNPNIHGNPPCGSSAKVLLNQQQRLAKEGISIWGMASKNEANLLGLGRVLSVQGPV